MQAEPLGKDQAKTALNGCIEDGTVAYTKHFSDELANDNLTMEDVRAVCRTGVIVMSPEKDIRTGDWKYRIEGLTAEQCEIAKMTTASRDECINCGSPVLAESVNYRYTESGLPNVVLQSVTVADCPKCGNTKISIPRMGKIHRTIARALADSPVRLTGAEFRFLRKHLGLNGDELGRYLHTDKTKISKWETEEDKIGPATDRLIRLLATALDKELSSQVSAVAEHFPQIRDESGRGYELHIDVHTLQTAFISVLQAA